MDSGIYILLIDVAEPFATVAGRLGEVHFRPGWYLYVGSAQRNLGARIARHARADKQLRWHIDYLTSRAEVVGVVEIEGGRDRECEVAAELAERFQRPIRQFGSSDCRCGGHLFYTRQL
ncbi:MAG: GIY-YIG nuclease family protein [Phycisphaerae bacterium]